MKKVMVFLDDETGSTLETMAKADYRSVKSMAEMLVLDAMKRRSDGLTDAEYVERVKTIRSGK